MSAPVEKKEGKSSSFWDNGPGPAGVMLPPTIGFIEHDKTRRQMPAYSLGLKLPSILIGSGLSPGPKYEIPAGMTAKGPIGVPAYTLRKRTKILGVFSTDTPGPAAYNPEINVNRRKAPEYSLSSRHRLNERGRASPGPIYLLPPALGPVIPDKPAGPAVSIKSRAIERTSEKQSPGPVYDIGRPDIIKSKAGEVSMKGNRKEGAAKSFDAGPGSHDIANAKIWRQPPSFSMGIRHSPFAGTMLTECDKQAY